MFSTSFPRDENYENEMINRLIKMGAQDYIRKSDDIAQLKNTILLAINKAIENKMNKIQGKLFFQSVLSEEDIK
jgi:DNA-binding NarL/FixJ family response regulator